MKNEIKNNNMDKLNDSVFGNLEYNKKEGYCVILSLIRPVTLIF